MDKQEFMQHVGQAYDKSGLRFENLFLFHLYNFKFSYDEEKRLCRIECPVSETMLNPHGFVHGGVYTFMADSAMGHLNHRFKGAPYVSLELKTSYLKSTNKGKLVATARYVREGHKVVFMECPIENEEGELMAVTSGTFYRIER